MKLQIIPKTVSRKHLLIKVFMSFIAGTIATDSMNSIYYHYLNEPAAGFIMRPQSAFLGLAFVAFIIYFILFVRTKWDTKQKSV